MTQIALSATGSRRASKRFLLVARLPVFSETSTHAGRRAAPIFRKKTRQLGTPAPPLAAQRGCRPGEWKQLRLKAPGAVPLRMGAVAGLVLGAWLWPLLWSWIVRLFGVSRRDSIVVGFGLAASIGLVSSAFTKQWLLFAVWFPLAALFAWLRHRKALTQEPRR